MEARHVLLLRPRDGTRPPLRNHFIGATNHQSINQSTENRSISESISSNLSRKIGPSAPHQSIHPPVTQSTNRSILNRSHLIHQPLKSIKIRRALDNIYPLPLYGPLKTGSFEKQQETRTTTQDTVPGTIMNNFF